MQTVTVHETDINVLILSNVNIVNQVDHSASSEFLDICVFSELLKPALLLRQPTHHAVSLTGEPHNGVACLLDLLVELSCEGFVFLTADKIALEVFISTGFQSAVLINDFFLKRNFALIFSISRFPKPYRQSASTHLPYS